MKKSWYSNIRYRLLLEDDNIEDIDDEYGQSKNSYSHIDLFDYFKKLYAKGLPYALLVTVRKSGEHKGPILLFDAHTNGMSSLAWDNEWSISNVISNSTRLYLDIANISKDTLINYIITDRDIQIVDKYYNDVDITIIKLHDMEEPDDTNIDYDKLDELLPINNEISIKERLSNYFNNIKNNEKLECVAIRPKGRPIPVINCFKENGLYYEGYRILDWGDEQEFLPRLSNRAGYDFLVVGFGSAHLRFFKYEIVNPKSII